MKKIYKAFVFVLVASAVLCGLYMNMFPKAEKIILPESEKIQEIKVRNGNDEINTFTLNDEINNLMKKLITSVPTRKQSVSEVPAQQTEDIRVLEIITNDEITTLFIYKERDRWFIEQPYCGIYKADNELVQMIAA